MWRVFKRHRHQYETWFSKFLYIYILKNYMECVTNRKVIAKVLSKHNSLIEATSPITSSVSVASLHPIFCKLGFPFCLSPVHSWHTKLIALQANLTLIYNIQCQWGLKGKLSQKWIMAHKARSKWVLPNLYFETMLLRPLNFKNIFSVG